MKKDEKWYKSTSNILFAIACTILGIMLIINLSIMIQAKKNEDVVPSVFGYKPFMVLSGSMESAIHKGDLIFTKIIDPETLKINDVIAFRDAAGTITTHRIIDMVVENGETYFITKGDNNNSQDKNLVALDDVEGLYVGRIPGIGSLMSSLSEPTTIVVLVLGVTAIFVISFYISNKKQQELERQEFLEYKRSVEQGNNRRNNPNKYNNSDNSYDEYWEFKRMQEEKNNPKKEAEQEDEYWDYNEENDFKDNSKYYDETEDDVWDYNKMKEQQDEVKHQNIFDDNVEYNNKNNEQHRKNTQNKERYSEYKPNNKQQNYQKNQNQNRNRNNYYGTNNPKNNQSNNQKQYDRNKQQNKNRENGNFNYSNSKNKSYNNYQGNKSKNYSQNKNYQNNNRDNYRNNKNNNGQYNNQRQHDKEWEEFLEFKRMKEQNSNKD